MPNTPIILIGTHRSGTTWLGNVLSRHPDLAYIEEPRHIWVRGNAYRPDDVLTEADARPSIREQVRCALDQYVRAHGRRRLLEKTPSNCFRLPFIRACLPDARILMVVRDGRGVIRSADEILRTGSRWDRIWNRVIHTPIWEWPAQFPLAYDTFRQKITGRPMKFWGPRPPGWKEWIKSDEPLVILAKQWSAAVGRAIDDAASIPPDQFHMFRYEDLLQDPRAVMERVVDFAKLPNAAAVVEYADKSCKRDRADAWKKEYDQRDLAAMRPHMEPTLTRLGYAW